MQGELKEQEVNLKDYIRILLRGRWIILISFIVVVSSTVYFTFTAEPVYEASALVMLKNKGGVQQQIFEVASYIQKETQINNQVEILKSRTLAENVITRLHESPYRDSLRILGNYEGRKPFSLTGWIFSLLKSKKKDLSEMTFEEKFDKLVENFRERTISVTPKRDTDIIELKVQAASQFEASFIANTWMEAYQDLDIKESRGEVSQVKKFIEEKMKDMQKELTSAEDKLKEYKETHDVAELTAETQQIIEQSAEFEKLYQAAQTDLEATRMKLTSLKSHLDDKKMRSALETTLSSPVIAEMEKQLAYEISAKAALEEMAKKQGLTNVKANDIKSAQDRIDGIRKKILAMKRELLEKGGLLNPEQKYDEILINYLEAQTEIKALEARKKALSKIVSKYNRKLDALPGTSLKLARLQRDVEVKNKIYMMLVEKYEENRIAEAGEIGSVRIVDRAKPPDRPIKPKKKLNILLGIMVGLGLGIGLTFLREYMDNSLKSAEDIDAMGVPVIGSIPFISPSRSDKSSGDLNGVVAQIESRMVTHFAPKSPVSEAYRTLRPNIQYARADKPVKSFLVTSSGPGEGKSTTAANLAITFAQMGARTLLIDADMRRPVLHNIFRLPKRDGLTNLLVGKISTTEAVQKTSVKNLHLIAAGIIPPNPSELLASKSMDNVLKELNQYFDIMICDTPPVIAVTDPAVLSTKLDGVVLVVKSEETNRDAFLHSRTLLNNVNATILGVIVNGIRIEHMYGSYYHYYQQYYESDGKYKKSSRKIIV